MSKPFCNPLMHKLNYPAYRSLPVRSVQLLFALAAIVFHIGENATGGEPPMVSGIYPHLAMFNDEGECGTGAVVPWGNRLWIVTYAPHKPNGSTDKLYEITSDLTQTVRSESIGGTPANRMIHRESQQLFIGPYAIDRDSKVRVIPYTQMFGRPTGNARHLTAPDRKVYCASMEEGLYEIDVHTLEVTELWADEQKKEGRHSNLPGYHGKGLYSGQGRIVYANNGEHGNEALAKPNTPSGVLAEWDGVSDRWNVVRRNQFTEVTGPGGIYGNENPDDPIWSIGWDHRSLLLMCLDKGVWHTWRLPKASHSYDGAHGWNTEWPRIRDIGEEDSLLMTMHGMFWRFPKGFTATNSKGIQPRSRYLKVIGDFCRWNDRIVMGCDDTAKSEFLNKRRAKGEIAAPQSQSNLWFLEPKQIDALGPTHSHGGVWYKDAVQKGIPSDPFLFSGFQKRSLHIQHASAETIQVSIEVDLAGTGNWSPLRTLAVPAIGAWFDLSDSPDATWIRLRCEQDISSVTAWFSYSQPDARTASSDARFEGLAMASTASSTGGIVRARGGNLRTLHFVANEYSGAAPAEIGLYQMDETLQLKRVQDAAALQFEKEKAAIPKEVLVQDDASILYIDDQKNRWRLPRAHSEWRMESQRSAARVCREVATERDLFHAGGLFYELPAENAGGFTKVSPIATHPYSITDFCSWRGLLVLSGVDATAKASEHIRKSDDGRVALWVGAADDLWTLGKPRGVGGPWKNTSVEKNVPSDPYLFAGFDKRTLELSHQSEKPIEFIVECDVTGSGDWMVHRRMVVAPKTNERYSFPPAYQARWIRIQAKESCTASAQLLYE